MEKLLNVENDWDGEVDCPEVMGPCCLISEEEVVVDIKGLKIGKAAGLTGVVAWARLLEGGVVLCMCVFVSMDSVLMAGPDICILC